MRDKLELKWAPDSLFFDLDQNAPSSGNDSTTLTNPENGEVINQEDGKLKEEGSTRKGVEFGQKKIYDRDGNLVEWGVADDKKYTYIKMPDELKVSDEK